MKTDSLSARYDAVSQSHSERFSALEQAQVLVARFWETHEELEPWLGETETLITQLPPPAIDTDALRLQQDQMRVRENCLCLLSPAEKCFGYVINFLSILSPTLQLLRESIAEHKPHIDKLLKIGPQLAKLSLQEGASVIQRYTEAERRYLAIKEGVKGRATSLDEAVSQSAQVRHRRQINCFNRRPKSNKFYYLVFFGARKSEDFSKSSVKVNSINLNYILCVN